MPFEVCGLSATFLYFTMLANLPCRPKESILNLCYLFQNRLRDPRVRGARRPDGDLRPERPLPDRHRRGTLRLAVGTRLQVVLQAPRLAQEGLRGVRPIYFLHRLYFLSNDYGKLSYQVTAKKEITKDICSN